MKCKQCGERWTLECTLGPGGSASPGQYLVVALVAAALAIIVVAVAISTGVLYALIGAALFGFLSVLALLESLTQWGYQEPRTAYQGSICPKCGTRNWIWPWSF